MGERGEIEKRGYEFVDSWVGERERGANGGSMRLKDLLLFLGIALHFDFIKPSLI
jgi:hypothetical protein